MPAQRTVASSYWRVDGRPPSSCPPSCGVSLTDKEMRFLLLFFDFSFFLFKPSAVKESCFGSRGGEVGPLWRGLGCRVSAVPTQLGFVCG